MRMLIKGKENVCSVPPKEGISSQQTPYFKEIVDLIVKMTKEAWEGFSEQIKAQ